ncbi:MAG: asparagine synthase (glutamine-hydrolyzing) [Gemmatimonadaceae bacterium]
MCGFAGIARREPRGVSAETLRRMAAAIAHRGPDGFGLSLGSRVGLAHVRLSIIDLGGGAQPMATEDGRLVVAFNGEIFNYVELTAELRAKGYRFRTRSDTEVLLHGYAEWGARMVERLNGDFAFALHDRRGDRVLLARDRFGVRPLFYAMAGADLVFGSEVKALFASGEVEAGPDLAGLDEVFTFWSARAPRTVFRGVKSLEPGCLAVWSDGRMETRRYYALSFDAARDEPTDAVEALDRTLRESTSIRMRADVPVGGYLSGGLDSTITCALAAPLSPYDFRTFSVTFADPALDESRYQQLVATKLGSVHRVRHIDGGAIARVFPEVVRHVETPLVRTAPAPLYLLAQLTRDAGVKTVLTGEGSDELFLGYDLFKETKVRLFCLRRPESRARPALFDRLYPYLGGNRGGEFWRKFFLSAATSDDPLFSHLPRFGLTARMKAFYQPEVRAALSRFDPLDELRAALPVEFGAWDPMNRAAYLEITTLLSSYLLSSQGDRVAMAHAVEGRFPFLDHRLFELAAALPTGSKLRGLREKEILKRWARTAVPREIADRHKQPYRAPDVPAFFGAERPDYVRDLLAPEAVRKVGLFEPAAVEGLVRRCESGRATGFAESQALVAILSTHLWHETFFGQSSDRALGVLRRPDVILDATPVGV